MAQSESGGDSPPPSWKDARDRGAKVLPFIDIAEFSRELQQRGVEGDPAQLLPLDANYTQSTERYLLLSVKDFESDPNNLLYLNGDGALLYSKKPWDPKSIKIFQKIIEKPYGLTTAVAFVVLERVYDSHLKHFNGLVERYRALEQTFDEKEHAALSGAFERFLDKIEELTTTLTTLERQTIKEVATKSIPFDYSLLSTEANRLLERAETRLSLMGALAQNYELKISRQLNERLERLNVTIKFLTALTIIFMVPNIIAGHFGMNFRNMPELEIPWAYPAVIAAQVIIVLSIYRYFKKKEFL